MLSQSWAAGWHHGMPLGRPLRAPGCPGSSAVVSWSVTTVRCSQPVWPSGPACAPVARQPIQQSNMLRIRTLPQNRKTPVYRHPRHACTIKPRLVNIYGVIRSYAGSSDEARRRLCYDQHHVWLVAAVVTLPAVVRAPEGEDRGAVRGWEWATASLRLPQARDTRARRNP